MSDYEKQASVQHENVGHVVTREYMNTNNRTHWYCRSCGMQGSYQEVA